MAGVAGVAGGVCGLLSHFGLIGGLDGDLLDICVPHWVVEGKGGNAGNAGNAREAREKGRGKLGGEGLNEMLMFGWCVYYKV